MPYDGAAAAAVTDGDDADDDDGDRSWHLTSSDFLSNQVVS